jgi:hypothetical protein
MSKEHVKVKILKQVGQHKAGDVVAVSPEVAEQLCSISKVSLGDGKVAHHQKAMLESDYNEMLKKKPTAGGLTQGEMAEMGAKNIVETPTDDAFAKKLKKMQAGKDAGEPAAPKAPKEPKAKATPKASKSKKTAAADEGAQGDAASTAGAVQ